MEPRFNPNLKSFYYGTECLLGTEAWVKDFGRSGDGRKEERISIPCVPSVFEENKVQ